MSVPTAPHNLVAEAGAGYVNLTWSTPTSDGGSAIIEYEIISQWHSNSTSASHAALVQRYQC